MDIRKPKPIHNIREFLKEVGIIVLGVCIALTAEQGVEWWHWRSQVTQARAVIATEMAYNIGAGISRLRSERCVEQRLDALGQILDKASATGSLPPLGDIGMPPLRQWSSGAWESVVASQAATHFPRQQLADLGFSYAYIHKSDSNAVDEVNTWTDLHAMVGPGRRLDAASEAELRRALGRARWLNRGQSILAVRIIQRLPTMNLSFSKADQGIIAEARDRPPRPSDNSACRPIPAPPAAYGGAPHSDFQAVFDHQLAHLPDFSR